MRSRSSKYVQVESHLFIPDLPARSVFYKPGGELLLHRSDRMPGVKQELRDAKVVWDGGKWTERRGEIHDSTVGVGYAVGRISPRTARERNIRMHPGVGRMPWFPEEEMIIVIRLHGVQTEYVWNLQTPTSSTRVRTCHCAH